MRKKVIFGKTKNEEEKRTIKKMIEFQDSLTKEIGKKTSKSFHPMTPAERYRKEYVEAKNDLKALVKKTKLGVKDKKSSKSFPPMQGKGAEWFETYIRPHQIERAERLKREKREEERRKKRKKKNKR